MFYEVAFLDGQRRAAMKLSPEAQERLTLLLAMVAGDPVDPICPVRGQRRHFDRRSMLLPAIVKAAGRTSRATIFDMSPGGMFLVTQLEVEVGDVMLAKIGEPGMVQYSFPCRVVRVEQRGGSYQVALALSGIPLEVHYGGQPFGEELQIRTSA